MKADTPRTPAGFANDLLQLQAGDHLTFEKWLGGYISQEGQWLGLPAIASAVYDIYGDRMQDLINQSAGIMTHKQYETLQKMEASDITYQAQYEYIRQEQPKIQQIAQMDYVLTAMTEAEDLKEVGTDLIEVLHELKKGEPPRPYHLTVLHGAQQALSKPFVIYPIKAELGPAIEDKGLVESDYSDRIMTKLGHLTQMCENALAKADRTMPPATGRRFEL